MDLKKHLISVAESEVLAKEYEKSNYKTINNGRPSSKPDSKTFVYELEVLQAYINLIRDGMEKQGVKSKGIKITLGKYPEDDSDVRLNPIYKGYQTIFFSPHEMDSTHEAKESFAEELPNLNYGQISPPY